MRKFFSFALLMSLLSANVCADQHFADKIFTAKDMLTTKLNPSGELAVSIHVKDENQLIKLRRVSDIKDVQPLSITDWVKGDFHITRLAWIDNAHIAVQLNEIRTGIQDLADSKSVKRLIIIRTPQNSEEKPKVFSVRTKGWLVSTLPEQAGVFLYAKSGLYSKVYKVSIDKLSEHGKKLSKLERIDGGQFKKSNEQAKVKGYATRWFVDSEGKVTSVMHYKSKDELALTALQDKGEDTTIATWKRDEDKGQLVGEDGNTMFPVSLGQSNTEYFSLDLEEDNERSVYKVDFENDTQELVYKSDAYKVVSIELNDARTEITAVRVLIDGKIEYDFLTRDSATDKALAKQDDAYRAVISQNKDGSVSIVYAESFAEPGQFYLWHRLKAK